ncbi:MAG: Rieske (2Fe-2S) protein [Calditrichaeota bacterium]|nr:Rieske (2Fe-2S) protein [Calditrichota bacterium]
MRKRWQQQFSRVQRPARAPIPRRRLINWIIQGGLLGFLASVLWPLIRYIIPPDVEAGVTSGVVEAGTLDDFPVNSGKIIRFGNQPVIVIRTPEGDVRAFSAICTHLACIVQYRADLQHIWCACHNGHYDLTGKNIAGPPPRPLPPYEVKIKDNRIFVSRAE